MKVSLNHFTSSICWNYVSFLCVVLSGGVLHLIAGEFFGADGLGVFALVFAFYTVSSQIASGGAHHSVHYARSQEGGALCNSMLPSALFIVLCSSIAWCAIAWLGISFFSSWIENKDLEQAIVYILPGVAFFSLNKVLLFNIIGQNRLTVFAKWQMFRCFLTLLFAGIVIYQSMPLAYFCSIFSWVESCLFLSLSCCSLRHLSLSKKWLAFHFSYSKRAYISGFLQTAYTRVDILMLGFFVSESSIGIYSIAAMVVEGFHQFVAAFRYNLNPILARLIADKKQSRSLSNFCRSVVLKSYVVALMLGAIALVAYKPGLSLLGLQPFFLESFPFFVVLLCGLLLVAGFIPLGQIFLQTNDPQVHSALLFLSIIVNVALNLTLIPMMGVMGAAIATALTFVLHAALLVLRMRKYFLIDFFTWLQRNNA